MNHNLPKLHKHIEDIPVDREGPFESPSLKKVIVDYATQIIDMMEKLKRSIQDFEQGEIPDDHNAMHNLSEIHKYIHCINTHLKHESQGFHGNCSH